MRSPPARIGILLLPSFNALATMALVDPFRAANYIEGRQLYDWDFLSCNGNLLTASNTAHFTPTPLDESVRYQFIFVSASWTPEVHGNPRLYAWLRKCEREGAIIGGIDTGAFVLGFAGLLKGYAATVHYEHLASFEELFPDTKVVDSIFVSDRSRLTCCGGIACSDMALSIVLRDHGYDLANAAALYIFHGRLRAGDISQTGSHIEPIGYAVPPALKAAIDVMERNCESPLTLSSIAQQARLSLRSMERVFKTRTGLSAVQYYTNVRLDRARAMVTQTDMKIVAIAAACGFSSPEYMARLYKRRFGIQARQDRREGRIPFHFRLHPTHAGRLLQFR
jgi:transcriptional regulator GlxA family with amidase domain